MQWSNRLTYVTLDKLSKPKVERRRAGYGRRWRSPLIDANGNCLSHGVYIPGCCFESDRETNENED